MTAISVSERLLEMAAFYTPLALTVTFLRKKIMYHIQKVLRGKLETRIFFNEQGHSVFAVG